MLGVDSSKLLIVAIPVIGPKDLPRAMLLVGPWVGKVRGYARHFTAGIRNVIREAKVDQLEKTGVRKVSASSSNIRRTLESPTSPSRAGAGRPLVLWGWTNSSLRVNFRKDYVPSNS
jgi:Sec-independent protein translocase protein TatA